MNAYKQIGFPVVGHIYPFIQTELTHRLRRVCFHSNTVCQQNGLQRVRNVQVNTIFHFYVGCPGFSPSMAGVEHDKLAIVYGDGSLVSGYFPVTSPGWVPVSPVLPVLPVRAVLSVLPVLLPSCAPEVTGSITTMSLESVNRNL